jgi:hypothetical protein
MNEIAKELNMSIGKIHKYFKIYCIEPRKNLTDASKAKISIANKNNNFKKGKKATNETKEKLRVAKLKKGIGHKKTRKDGYVAIYFPDHPKSNKDGYIMEHVLIMECFIGRWIKDDEVVHHINKKRNDNRIENLKLMTKREHAKFHLEERRIKKKGMMTYQ